MSPSVLVRVIWAKHFVFSLDLAAEFTVAAAAFLRPHQIVTMLSGPEISGGTLASRIRVEKWGIPAQR